VDQVGNPEEHAEDRDGQENDRRHEGARSVVATAPGFHEAPSGKEREQDQHRPNQKCGEILMAKLRAAEGGTLGDGSEDGEHQECTVEYVDATPQCTLNEIDRCDSDGQRAEDEMKLLEQDEI